MATTVPNADRLGFENRYEKHSTGERGKVLLINLSTCVHAHTGIYAQLLAELS